MIISFEKRKKEHRILIRYHEFWSTHESKAKFTMAIKWPEVRKRVPFYYSRDSLPTSCSSCTSFIYIPLQPRASSLGHWQPSGSLRLVMNFALHRWSTLKLAHDPLFQTFHPFIYLFISFFPYPFSDCDGENREKEFFSNSTIIYS